MEMKNIIKGRLKNLTKNQEAIVFMTACLIIGIVMLIIGVIMMIFLVGQIKEFISGGGCFLLVIPLAIIIVIAILAKKYLFQGGFPGLGGGR